MKLLLFEKSLGLNLPLAYRLVLYLKVQEFCVKMSRFKFTVCRIYCCCGFEVLLICYVVVSVLE